MSDWRFKISLMCGQHIVMGLTRTLSSMLPVPVKGAAKDRSLPQAVPPGTRICAPAKARC
jgi:hypothetical protein